MMSAATAEPNEGSENPSEFYRREFRKALVWSMLTEWNQMAGRGVLNPEEPRLPIQEIETRRLIRGKTYQPE